MLTATACSAEGITSDGYTNTSITDAHKQWRQATTSPGKILFIDVRTPEEYGSGHIPGAKSIPLQHLTNHLSEIPHNTPVYLYCHSGGRSAKAATILARQGFTNIHNVLGGIVAWKKFTYEVSQ